MGVADHPTLAFDTNPSGGRRQWCRCWPPPLNDLLFLAADDGGLFVLRRVRSLRELPWARRKSLSPECT